MSALRSILLKFWLVAVLVASVQLLPNELHAQSDTGTADVDPAGILTRVRDTYERFLQDDFEYRFSLLPEDAWARYAQMNLDLGNQTGISYLVAYTPALQIGTQGGLQDDTANHNMNVIVGWAPPWQSGPNQGGFILQYLNVSQLTKTNGAQFSQSLGLSSFTSDSPVNIDSFQTIAWRQQFVDGLLEMRVGQFLPGTLFNSNSYASDDTRSFLSTPLSSEPSRTHPDAGIGAVVIGQILPDVFLGGALVDANGAGEFLDFDSFFQGDYMTNVYVAWKPNICGLGPGSYQFAMYFVDATESDSYSRGLGINIEQSLREDLAVFCRYNQSDKRNPLIRKSAAAGVMCTNPFGWSDDWLGVGVGWSDPTDQSLRDEYVLESFWRIQLTPNTQVTPGAQIWLDPSMTPGDDVQAAFTLRAMIEL